MPTTFIKNLFHFSIPILAVVTIMTLSLQVDVARVYAGTTPPTTSYVQTPSSPDGNNDWYVSDVQFDITATDLESGVKEINYRIDEGAWQKVSFTSTQNLAPNPSFETAGATSTGAASWEASVNDPESVFSRDTTEYTPGYSTASVKMVTTGGTWHGIHHKDNYVPAVPYDNMTASVWIKIANVPGQSKFRVYAILNDDSVVELAESSQLTSTVDWTLLSVDFVVNNSNAKGVYVDIGHTGPGTLFADAVTITSSLKETNTSVIIGSDSANHKLEFYSVDNADNTETYSCIAPIKNCIEFKLDQTPPTNWRNGEAFRPPGANEHTLYVHVDVDDATSGLSASPNAYTYQTDVNPGEYGSFSDLLACNSTWTGGASVALGEGVLADGDSTAFLETQLTAFCNNDWKTCKSVRFDVEDMAGNTRTKDFCINGPWIKFTGGGVVRSNHSIDMLSEPPEDNTDGLVEIGGNVIDFFSSAQDWVVKNSPTPTDYDYDRYWNITDEKTEIIGDLVSSTGVYVINGNYEIDGAVIPGDYDDATFDQIVFVDGDLLISNDVEVGSDSTALFIVRGKVEIDENVDVVGIGILADGDFYTAYNVEDKTAKSLVLNGVYSANRFYFQRTLQGTNNETTPSEDFIYEPKYLIQQKDLFSGSSTLWRYDQ